jgi:hypothetical protein
MPDSHRSKSKRSQSKKALAVVTAAGVLALGGVSVASAAEGGAGAQSDAAAAASRRPAKGVGLRTAFGAAATTLGMSTEELRAAMRSGPQSIASVAGDRAPEVTDGVVGALDAALDEAVASGRIRAERADRVRERLPEAAQRFVDWVPGSGRSA